jgi:hypothetical protein
MPWTWPAMEVRAAADSPAPVIYSVYGIAAALAIAIVALAARRGPIPVTFAGAAGLMRSSFESVRGRMERMLPVSRFSTSPSASLATALPEDTPKGPARSSDSGRASLRVPRSPQPGSAGSAKYRLTEWYPGKKQIATEGPNGHAPAAVAAIPDQRRADEREAFPEPTGGRGQARESRGDATVKTDAGADAETQTYLAAKAASLTEGQATPKAGVTPAGPMRACSEPGCSGMIVDDYCDVCGSPASAPRPAPAGAAVSAASSGTAAGPVLTPGRPMTACSEPGCTGVILDDYCDVCGSPATATGPVPAGAAVSAASPATAAGPGQSPIGRMTACSEPGCTGVILDDYCDICGSPASTPDSIPAGAAVSAASPAPAAWSAPTPVPRIADAGSATDAVPTTTGAATRSATETAPPTTAEGEDPTTVAAAATNAAPALDQGSRHQRRPLGRTQRRKASRR